MTKKHEGVVAKLDADIARYKSELQDENDSHERMVTRHNDAVANYEKAIEEAEAAKAVLVGDQEPEPEK